MHPRHLLPLRIRLDCCARQFLSLRAQGLELVFWLVVFALLPRGDAAMAADSDLAQRIQRGESFLTNLFDYKDGKPVGLANVETTCLSLLAVQTLRE